MPWWKDIYFLSYTKKCIKYRFKKNKFYRIKAKGDSSSRKGKGH